MLIVIDIGCQELQILFSDIHPSAENSTDYADTFTYCSLSTLRARCETLKN